MGKLYLHSIFSSFSGEVGLIPQGARTTFIRLGGCNIRCNWCDTEKALTTKGSEKLKVSKIAERAIAEGNHLYLITGGEPLMQKALDELVEELAKSSPGVTVQIETNGTLFPTERCLAAVDCFVFDFKLEGSGVHDRMMSIDQFSEIPDGSFIKFVVDSWLDFQQALKVRDLVQTKAALGDRIINFAWSPGPNLPPKTLAVWVLEAELRFDVFNIQIHKHIFPDGEKEK